MTRKISPSLTLRPLSTCFEKFSHPNSDTYVRRLRLNLDYFKANYLALLALLLVYVCVARPLYILGLAAVAGGAYYLFFVRESPIVVGTRVVTRRETALGFAGAAYLVMALTGRGPFHVAVLLWVLFVLVHASLRTETISARVSKLVNKYVLLVAASGCC